MELIIPTYRRTHRQRTWDFLKQSVYRDKVVAVCDSMDRGELERLGLRTMLHPKEVDTIAKKRAWILREFYGQQIVMFDDDLRFYERQTEEGPKLVKCDGDSISRLFENFGIAFHSYRHFGVSARGGNNRQPPRGYENGRAMYVLGYDTKAVVDNCEIGRIEHREDMDYTLQMLRYGFPNYIFTRWACDNQYNERGGASRQRTVEGSNADALLLEQLHPGFVKARERQYKASIPRIEVTCAWKKAYQSSAAFQETQS